MYDLYEDRYVYMYTYPSQYREAGLATGIKLIGSAINVTCHRFASPGLLYLTRCRNTRGEYLNMLKCTTGCLLWSVEKLMT
jgi:hypothetical protein